MQNFDLSGLSPRNRRYLELGVRGGSGEPTLDELLAEVENLATMDDDAIAQLREDLRVAGLELLTDPTDEKLAKADEVKTARAAIKTVIDERTAAAAAIAEQAAALAADFAEDADLAADGDDGEAADGDDDDADADGDGDGEDADADADGDADGEDDADADASADTPEPDADGEAERIAAAASARITRVEARRPGSMRPRARAKHTPQALKLTASANLPGVPAGSHLDNPDKIAAAFGEAISLCRGFRGGRQQVRVASLGAFDAAEVYGEERTLRWDPRENERRMDALCSPEAIKAAGGICAPAPVDYTQPVMGVDDRPVWNGMLARMGADRGGVRTLPVPTLSDVESGVDVWTEENDVDPSDPATKPCVTMTCPDEVITLVDAYTKCLKVGNFRQRYWSEQVEAWLQKLAVQAARFAESRHLTTIGTASTQVAVDQVLGTTRDVLAALDRAGAQMRNFYRFDPDQTLTFGAPAWLLDNMITDLSREQPGSTAERLATSDALLESFFTSRGITPTWFLDGEAGQIFGAQGDGLLLKWPSQVITYLYPTGVWKGLDGGSLDFGVVRDSTLNATNDLMIFSETFEAVHFHGDGASYRIAVDICANGATSAAVDIDVCSTGS